MRKGESKRKTLTTSTLFASRREIHLVVTSNESERNVNTKNEENKIGEDEKMEEKRVEPRREKGKKRGERRKRERERGEKRGET